MSFNAATFPPKKSTKKSQTVLKFVLNWLGGDGSAANLRSHKNYGQVQLLIIDVHIVRLNSILWCHLAPTSLILLPPNHGYSISPQAFCKDMVLGSHRLSISRPDTL